MKNYYITIELLIFSLSPFYLILIPIQENAIDKIFKFSGISFSLLALASTLYFREIKEYINKRIEYISKISEKSERTKELKIIHLRLKKDYEKRFNFLILLSVNLLITIFFSFIILSWYDYISVYFINILKRLALSAFFLIVINLFGFIYLIVHNIKDIIKKFDILTD